VSGRHGRPCRPRLRPVRPAGPEVHAPHPRPGRRGVLPSSRRVTEQV